MRFSTYSRLALLTLFLKETILFLPDVRWKPLLHDRGLLL